MVDTRLVYAISGDISIYSHIFFHSASSRQQLAMAVPPFFEVTVR
jgi:hypothetical protein